MNDVWYRFRDPDWGLCPVLAIDFQGQRVKYCREDNINETKIGIGLNDLVYCKIENPTNKVAWEPIGFDPLNNRTFPASKYGGQFDPTKLQPNPSRLISKKGRVVELIYTGAGVYRPSTRVPGYGVGEIYFGLHLPGCVGYNSPLDLPDDLYDEYRVFTGINLMKYEQASK